MSQENTSKNGNSSVNDCLKQIADMAGYRQRLRYDDVKDWPIEDLEKAGFLKKSISAKMVECDGCTEKCEVPVKRILNEKTEKTIGFHICQENPTNGVVPIDLKRQLQYNINIKKLQEAGYLTTNEKTGNKKSNQKFTPWKTPGDVCFVIKDNRVLIWNGDDYTDLKLRNGSNTEKLVHLLAGSTLTQKDVKTEICATKTKPSEAVRDVNRMLNTKIKSLNIQNIPTGIEYIGYDKNKEQYFCRLPIKPYQENELS